jgi:hypothetical protein
LRAQTTINSRERTEHGYPQDWCEDPKVCPSVRLEKFTARIFTIVIGCAVLQTDANRARVLDGLAGASQKGETSAADLGRSVQRLAPRWFIIKNAHEASVGPIILHPRQTMSFMRGPMKRNEILVARQWRASMEGVELPPNSLPRPTVIVEIPESLRKPKAFGFTDSDDDA